MFKVFKPKTCSNCGRNIHKDEPYLKVRHEFLKYTEYFCSNCFKVENSCKDTSLPEELQGIFKKISGVGNHG